MAEGRTLRRSAYKDASRSSGSPQEPGRLASASIRRRTEERRGRDRALCTISGGRFRRRKGKAQVARNGGGGESCIGDPGHFPGLNFYKKRGPEHGLLEGAQGGDPGQVPCERDVDEGGVRPLRRLPVRADPLEVRLRRGGRPPRPARARGAGKVRGAPGMGALPPRDEARGPQAARGRHGAEARGQAPRRRRRPSRPRVGLEAGAPRRARRQVPPRLRARGSCYDVRARVVRSRDSRTDRRGQEDRVPLAGQGRRRPGTAEEGEGRRGHGREGGSGRAGRVGARMGGAAGRPRGEGARGGGPARRGAGGVGRPKSTRPGLFEQRGEAPGGPGGQGDDGEGEDG